MTTHAANVMSGVSPSQLEDATPCTDWNVEELIDHMAAGADYLLAATTVTPDVSDEALRAIAHPGRRTMLRLIWDDERPGLVLEDQHDAE